MACRRMPYREKNKTAGNEFWGDLEKVAFRYAFLLFFIFFYISSVKLM
jgi:hypothetical protein